MTVTKVTKRKAKEPEQVEVVVVRVVVHVTPRMADVYELGYRSALNDVRSGRFLEK